MECPKVEDRSNWMSKLSGTSTRIPISWLAIPGSHDSGTSALVPSLGVVDKEPSSLKYLGDLCCCGSCIKKWSKTQNLTIKEQLYAGVRYLDVRVAKNPYTLEYRLVHALYGDLFFEALMDIRDFLYQNPREVIIFDFNHLYYLSSLEKQTILDEILKTLGQKLVPPPSQATKLQDITLEAVWKSGYQVVLLCDDDECAKQYTNIWPRNFMQSKWANTFNVDKLMNFLEAEYNERVESGKEGLYVFQGVCGAQPLDFITSPWSGMEGRCSEATERFTKWLSNKKPGPRGLNICMADFVEKHDFIATVININGQIRGRNYETVG